MNKEKTDYLSGYFLNHTVGVFPGQRQAINEMMKEYTTAWCDPVDGQWNYLMRCREEFLNRWGMLLGVDAINICSAENVTTAVYSLFSSLPQERLKNKTVLIAANCFPSLHFLLQGLQERYGYTLRTAKNDNQYYCSDQAYINAWDKDVAFAVLTWISSTTSHQIDLTRLISHGKEMGSLTCLDITQGAGIIPIDLDDLNVDFAVTTSLKWSFGSPGAGLLYVSPEKLDMCKPKLRGWFSQENPFSWDLDAFKYTSSANRFLNGTPSFLPCCASLPGLRWLADTGQNRILAHNRRLCADIIVHAIERGWNLLTPVEENARGGSLMFELPSRVDSEHLLCQLTSKQLYADVRGRILRLSPGYTTTEQAVGQLCRTLENYFQLLNIGSKK